MQQKPSPARRRPWTRAAPLAVLAGALIAFLALDGGQFLSLELIKTNRDMLLHYVHEHHALAALLAVAIYTGATALSIPGATVLSLTVGFLFGRWTGTVIILISATGGALLVFLATRYLFAGLAEQRMGKTVRRLASGFERDGFHYLLFLRLVPVFPFWLVNIAPAVTRLRVRTYMAATMLGILPGAFVFSNLGESLSGITGTEQLLSRQSVLALLLLGVFALIPVAVRHMRRGAGPGEEDAVNGGRGAIAQGAPGEAGRSSAGWITMNDGASGTRTADIPDRNH